MAKKRSTKRGKATIKVRTVRPGSGAKRRRENAASRRCGPCTACCSSLAINEIEKPEWATCPHLVEVEHAKSRTGEPSRVPVKITDERLRSKGAGGCSLYPDRPNSCAKFRCQWLAGMPLTDDRHRPDRIGLIIIDTADPRAVQVRELWAGAANEGIGKDLIMSLRRARLEVIIVAPGEQKTLTPLTVFGTPEVGTRSVGVRVL